MTFEELLDQAVAMLQRRGRVAYRVFKRQFNLADDDFADLKEAILYAHPQVVDEPGRGLVWTGATEPIAAAPTVMSRDRAALTYTPQHLSEKILASRRSLEGERKHVTVLFADIKDSTELIKDLDPEVAQQLLDPVLRLMMEGVHRYEGTVNQVLGDGIMALFGAPIAHEDHASRACYAALAMQAAMHVYTDTMRRTHGIEMRIRVGLNSGEVVVRAIGNDLHMDYSAVGQTTHLAARMEQLATPGTIRLTPATFRLVEGLVRVNALGPIPVKGMTEPVAVYELTGASAMRRRLQASVARGLTRFVGRETEIEVLNRALEQVEAGHGQIIAAVGEAGVGKSRLVYELVHSHHVQDWLVLESAAVSYGKATPYLPIIDLLKRYAHIEDSDDARTIRAKVTGHILTLDEALQESIPALLSLLEALPEDSPFFEFDPAQRRQRTLDALKRILRRESQIQPVLLVCEDLHWVDSATQALLDNLVESLPTTRLLLVLNYRPEYDHAWGRKTYYTQLWLDPLLPASAEALLRALLGDDASLVRLKQRLIQQTAGNPFFLEESVRTLVETQVLSGERGAYRVVQAQPTMQIPATVQAILAARIDRLPSSEKRLLQTAAVIGTEVPLSLLHTIAELPNDALHRGLTYLQAAEFLYETCLFPEREYTFKHALTHEVAYRSLLQERRRVLHAQIVATLEGFAGDRLVDQVERLAHHALRGEVWDKALGYFRHAGEKAEARSAYREAVACHEQALDALRHLPESRERREQAIDLRFRLRHALTPLGEFERGFVYLCEAETLAQALGDQYRLGWVSAFMALYFSLMGDQDRAIVCGQRALTMATALDNTALHDEASTYLAQSYHALGDYRRALDLLRTSVAALDSDRLRQRLDTGSQAPVFSRTVMALCLAEVGAFPEGTACAAEGLQIAEAANHSFSLILAYWGIGLLALSKGDVYTATPVLERASALCQAVKLPALSPIFVSALSYAYALAGRSTEALAVLQQAKTAVTSLEFTTSVFHALVSAWLGEVCLLAGRLDDALSFALQARDHSQEHRERGQQVRALLLLGAIAARRQAGQVEPAEADYRQALSQAEELGMRPLLAHSHLGLGTLYLQAERHEQARSELAAAIELYRAMDMTFWLPQAEAALAQVT